MPDILHFDKDEALEKMMAVFWQRGFKATTTRQLANSAGLSESSLFNTFGNKQAIYERTLDLYTGGHAHLLKKMQQGDSPLASLRAYWETIAGFAADKSRTNGCMITSAAIMDAENSEIADFVKRSFRRQENAFKKTLDKAVDRGELKKGTDTRALAKFLLHSTQGIRVMSRLSPDTKTMKNIVDGVMSAVDKHKI